MVWRAVVRRSGAARPEAALQYGWVAGTLLALLLGGTGDVWAAQPQTASAAPEAQVRAQSSRQQRRGQAQRALKTHQPKQAIRLLEPLVRRNPRDLESARLLAQAYADARRDRQAIALYERLAKEVPPAVRASSGFQDGQARTLAPLYLRTGQPRKALPLLRTAHGIHPWDLDLVDQLYRALRATGKEQEARELVRRSLRYYQAQHRMPPQA